MLNDKETVAHGARLIYGDFSFGEEHDTPKQTNKFKSPLSSPFTVVGAVMTANCTAANSITTTTFRLRWFNQIAFGRIILTFTSVIAMIVREVDKRRRTVLPWDSDGEEIFY